MKVEISQSRLKALLAAEEFCRAARMEYSDRGAVGPWSYPWFARWMRLAGVSKFNPPKETSPVWCCDCRCRHVVGRHCRNVEMVHD